MMEATKVTGWKYRKGVTKDCFLLDSQFSSKKASEAAIEVVAKLVSKVQKNTKVLCKDIIEKITKYWTGGSYLMSRSKPMVPGGRPLIDIVYKYNAWNVLYFIVTDNSGKTQAGLPQFCKYLDQFANVSIHPVALPIFMYKLFFEVNEVNSHNR